MKSKNHQTFWKYFFRVIVFIFATVAAFDVIVFTWHEYNWHLFYEELDAAEAAGYDEEYSVCSREEDILFDGKVYTHFHAYRSMILDGDYHEDLLVKSDSQYLDKVPDQDGDLIIFAKEVSSYHDLDGTSYTFIEIYSICDYTMDDAGRWPVIAILVTVLAVFIEVILVIIFIIHKICILTLSNLSF